MSQWNLIKVLCPRLYNHGMLFECSLGWFEIIKDLSVKIEKILEKDAEKYPSSEGGGEDNCIQMYAVQVKEKYGTLRFYMSCETDEISDLIKETEKLSHSVCENCGNPGTIRSDNGWFSVQCN